MILANCQSASKVQVCAQLEFGFAKSLVSSHVHSFGDLGRSLPWEFYRAVSVILTICDQSLLSCCLSIKSYLKLEMRNRSLMSVVETI